MNEQIRELQEIIDNHKKIVFFLVLLYYQEFHLLLL